MVGLDSLRTSVKFALTFSFSVECNMKIQLDSDFDIRNNTIRNRFLKSSMSEQLGDKENNPTQGLVNLYRIWAQGGVGISISGNIMVDRKGLGEPKNVVLDEESDLDAFRRWTKAATAEGTHFWAQLNHPGKQTPSYLTKSPVAPSAIPLGAGLDKAFNIPRALNEEEILKLIKMFTTSAKLAKDVGFTGVQIHGAHGYLVSQFLSPHHNQREDQWGGSLENRMRFVLEIYTSMREVLGKAFPISIKLNSADFQKGGFSEEESIEVMKTLSEAGMDLIEISGGNYEAPAMMGETKKVRESTKKREAYFLHFAEKLRQVIDCPICVTGGFRSSAAMLDALKSGATDFIGAARPYALFPDFPILAMADPDYVSSFSLPSTGSKITDRLFAINIVWFEQQLHLLAAGKNADANLSAWSTVWLMTKGVGLQAFRKRRS